MNSGKIIKFNIVILIFPILLFSKNNDLDINIKKILEKSKTILKDQGTIIFINTKNGKIEGIVNEKLAYQKLISPGSTFKLVTALASLKKNINNLSIEINCNDRFFLLGKEIKNKHINYHKHLIKIGDYYRCSQIGGHGKVDLIKAIKKSCNIFFFNIGDKIGYNSLYNAIIYFGFDKKVFATLSDEVLGYVTYEGERLRQVLSSIGDSGGILITPIQLGLFINYIASNGKTKIIKTEFNKKVIVSRIIDPLNKFTPFIPHIKKGLIKKVSTGTDFSQSNNFYFKDFAGKTGTSSIFKSNKTSGLFIGFSPIINSKISFVVYLKKGSGRDALQLLKKIIFF